MRYPEESYGMLSHSVRKALRTTTRPAVDERALADVLASMRKDLERLSELRETVASARLSHAIDKLSEGKNGP